MDLMFARPDGTAPQTLMTVDAQHWDPFDLSPDGSRALLRHYVSTTDSHPALFDLPSRQLIPIPRPAGHDPGKAAYGDLAFTADGRSALVGTDVRGEFLELARIDLATSQYTWLSEHIPWDVESIAVDRRHGHVAVTFNEDGLSALYVLEGDRLRKLDVPMGVLGSLEFSPDGSALGFTLSRPDAPADAYALVLADGTLTRWTYSEVGGLNAGSFVKPERIQFPSFDGRMIPAYVFRPRSDNVGRISNPSEPPTSQGRATPDGRIENPSHTARAPVLINIHGGPEGQYRPEFSEIDQFYLSELGIAVIRPNVRGSEGYGKTYVDLDNAEKREDSVRDIGALLDWIATQPDLDPARVAVYGGSYGGYMVLATLTHYSDRLRAGIDVVGIASFRTFLQNTSAYRRDLRRAEYGDERDPRMQAVFEKIDPLNNADRIRTALLVTHGRNDPRVPISEAEQIAPRVRANGQEVWTVYADNEGHGFVRKENRDYVTAVNALFLQKHLGAHFDAHFDATPAGASNGPPADAAGIAAFLLDDARPADRRQAVIERHPQLAADIVAAMAAPLEFTLQRADRSPKAELQREEYRRIPWIWRVSVAAGRRNRVEELRPLLDVALPRPGQPLRDWQAVVIGGGVINGLSNAGAWPGRRAAELIGDDNALQQRWRRSLQLAVPMADNESVPTGTRYDALRMIALLGWDESRSQLTKYLADGVNDELQMGAVSGLSDIESDGVAAALVSAIRRCSDHNRELALDALLRTPERAVALLAAVEAGKVSATTVAPKRVARLREHESPSVSRRARALFPE
jgi:dienelactone hydrolase